MKLKLEYLWLDGNTPQQIRSKMKIISYEDADPNYVKGITKDVDLILYQYKSGELKAPIWNFDGSSTNQASTKNSELLLYPCNYFLNPFMEDSIIVMCEVYNTDKTPHKSNKRAEMIKTLEELDQETMYGFEAEYFIYDTKTNKPLGWPEKNSYPRPQGEFYCGVGGNNVVGREFVEEHASLCEKMGLQISGINAEVALGQWEYQIGPVYASEGADQLWVSRYVLYRLSEKYGYYINLDPKPYQGNDWNGSGMHVNFSTAKMRVDMKNKKKLVIDACEKLSKKVKEHIEVYGVGNELRLTGANETCSINEFKWGIGDRSASIRIPTSIEDKKTTGYLEDRRPASNANPYEIVNRMVKTICTKSKKEKFEEEIVG